MLEMKSTTKPMIQSIHSVHMIWWSKQITDN